MNHGVLDEGMRMMKENVQGFFDLPHHEKQKSAQKPGSLEGYGQAFVTSHDRKLQWNDAIFLKCHPAHARNLDLWPKNPPEFRRIGSVDEKFRRREIRGRDELLPSMPVTRESNRLLPHADISGITPVDGVWRHPRLRVLSKDNCWVTVPPVPGGIVVNLGQIMEVYSNGTHRAPNHRALVNKEKERVSIATFCYPARLFGRTFSRLLAATGLPLSTKTLSNSENSCGAS
ncbi:S-norcoclaurine synthase 1-like [Eucalyptus grandis]|uniref:S-norcoclaurine synthase 1-like n=1 Tax=Eucalyptus grandis TaxID=71139 RepID=UPI00192E99DE|nr:S-norcoclaurine synthase 1-like [Eucalyptus grandis]